MTDVTQILQAVDAGDDQAVSQLLPLVYEELNRLATMRLSNEEIQQSLQTTDLVHEAYLRMFGDHTPSFKNRAHFFAAASEAMRRVLIDRARRRLSKKRGGNMHRVGIEPAVLPDAAHDQKLLRLHESLDKLETLDAEKVKLIKLRFFAGSTIQEAANVMGISTATADRHWRFAKAWLQHEME